METNLKNLKILPSGNNWRVSCIQTHPKLIWRHPRLTILYLYLLWVKDTGGVSIQNTPVHLPEKSESVSKQDQCRVHSTGTSLDMSGLRHVDSQSIPLHPVK